MAAVGIQPPITVKMAVGIQPPITVKMVVLLQTPITVKMVVARRGIQMVAMAEMGMAEVRQLQLAEPVLEEFRSGYGFWSAS